MKRIRDTSPVQWIIAFTGLVYLFVGVALLFAPRWFFENIGNFPPFNRHFLGDLGAFQLPLGVGLLWAARAPERHRSLIVVVIAGSLIHALNHLYDDLLNGFWASPQLWSQTLPLVLLVVVLYWAWRARARV